MWSVHNTFIEQPSGFSTGFSTDWRLPEMFFSEGSCSLLKPWHVSHCCSVFSWWWTGEHQPVWDYYTPWVFLRDFCWPASVGKGNNCWIPPCFKNPLWIGGVQNILICSCNLFLPDEQQQFLSLRLSEICRTSIDPCSLTKTGHPLTFDCYLTDWNQLTLISPSK